MQKESPVPQLNEWSCSMDALCWNLAKVNCPFSHDQIILQHLADFPVWNLYKGYLGRWDILNLLERMKLPFAGLLYSDKKEEILSVFSSRGSFLMGFAFLSSPTNHTLPIVGIAADRIILIGLEKDRSTVSEVLWEDFLTQNQGAVMLLFQK